MEIKKTICLWSGVMLLVGAQTALADQPYKGPGSQQGMMEQQQQMRQGEEPRARMGEMPRSEEGQKIMKATDAYAAIVKGPKGEVPHAVTEKARCVAVFTDVVSAAAVIGGSHGTGIASCRTAGGDWSKPAFLKMSSASVGLQLGAKSSDLVLFFMTPESEKTLKKGSFKLGADANVTAGNWGNNWDSGSASIVAYQRSEGGMMGVSLNGYSLTRDDAMNTNYYGRKVDYLALLENRAEVGASRDINAFISELPKPMAM